MADRNIDQSIRKPRRAKGTPFFIHRNYYSLATLAVAGVFWYLYELWPETKKLKKSLHEGKFKYSPETQEHILSMNYAINDPALETVIEKLKARRE